MRRYSRQIRKIGHFFLPQIHQRSYNIHILYQYMSTTICNIIIERNTSYCNIICTFFLELFLISVSYTLSSAQPYYWNSLKLSCCFNNQSNFYAVGCKIMQHYVTKLYNIMQHYVIRGDIPPHFRRIIAVNNRFCGDNLIGI